MRAVVLLVLAALAACAQDDAPAGAERGPCYGNATCNEGLLCLSDRCVRPPPADCNQVAEALASIELGNYAPREDRAPRVAALAARCRSLHVTKDEGACLLAATTIVEATFCPKPVLAPGRGPSSWGLPVECEEYVAILDRYSQCAALPEATRAALRDVLAQMRRSWEGLGPSAMTPARAQACAQGRDSIRQGMQQMGCP